MRYFERQSAQDMARTLGTSDVAAQKRCVRAIQRLREFFARRGVAVSAGSLSSLIETNAVQAAPPLLLTAISAGGALGGSMVSTVSTTSQIITMTSLQKTLITATFLAAVGAGLYETRQASILRVENTRLRAKPDALTEQIAELQRERDDLKSKLGILAEDLGKAKSNAAELLRLRGDVGRLRAGENIATDPFVQEVLTWKRKEDKLRNLFDERPNQRVPEMVLLEPNQWLAIARKSDLDSETGIRKALSETRKVAKNNFMPIFMAALEKYLKAKEGVLPDELSQIESFFEKPVEDSILQQYKLLHTGRYTDIPKGAWVASDKAVIDEDYDQAWGVGPNGYGMVTG